MWRKRAVILVLIAIAVAIFSSPALAASPPASVQSSLSMSGQVSIVNLGRTSQLRIKTSSTDQNKWLLEVSLNPLPTQSSSDTARGVTRVNGSFVLGLSQHPLYNGAVTGWVDYQGTGLINLTDPADSLSLAMQFSALSDYSVNSTVQGQWPVLPAAPAPVPDSINHNFWYLSRASAWMAYILLFINICLGLALKSKFLNQVGEKWRALDLHQFTAILAMGLVALHVFSLLGDHYLNYTVAQLLVPGVSPYRPQWVSPGIIGFYLLVLIMITSYLRRFIGKSAWRAVHLTSFVIFAISLIHGIGSGSDTSLVWGQLTYIVTGVVVVFLALWRFLGPKASEPDLAGSAIRP